MRSLLFIAFLSLYGCQSRVSDETRERTKTEAVDARSLAQTMNQKWRESINGRASIRQGFKPCAVEVIPPSRTIGDHYAASTLLGSIKGKDYAAHLFDELPVDADSPMWRKANRDLESAEYYLRPDTRYKKDRQAYVDNILSRVAEIGDPGFWTHDLTIVIEQETPAVIETDDRGLPKSTVDLDPYQTVTKTAFTPGTLSGSAFVYSYQEDRIVCAGRFSAANSTNIREHSAFSAGARWTLKDDLRGRAAMAAVRSLKQVNE